MRILMCIDGLRAGGKERQFVELLKALTKLNCFDIEVALMSEKIEYTSIKNLPVKIHFVLRRIRKDPTVFYLFYKICKEFKPDIIHVWDTMTCIYVVPASKILKKRIVNGSIRNARSALKPFTKRWFLKHVTVPLSFKVVANSRAGLRAFGLKASSKHKLIYNGFDFDRTDVIEKPSTVKQRFGIQTKKVVGMVANFTDAKDYRTYIDAALKIIAKRNDVTFVCVGDGKNMAMLKNLTAEASDSKIKFLGKRNDTDSIINIIDVGVLTTNTDIHAEGISNAIMEYMAFGKPVVATDSGGMREIVIDNQTGFIVKPFDVEGIVHRINLLLNDFNMAKKMGQLGKETIKKHFNLKDMLCNYLKLYAEGVNQKNSSQL